MPKNLRCTAGFLFRVEREQYSACAKMGSDKRWVKLKGFLWWESNRAYARCSSPTEFSCFYVVCWIVSKSTYSKNSFGNTIGVSKQFGSRLGPTLCRAWSGSKLFAKVIRRQPIRQRGKQLRNISRKCLTLDLCVYFICERSEGSDETAQMHSLAGACAARICNKYSHNMTWLDKNSNVDKNSRLMNN